MAVVVAYKCSYLRHNVYVFFESQMPDNVCREWYLKSLQIDRLLYNNEKEGRISCRYNSLMSVYYMCVSLPAV